MKPAVFFDRDGVLNVDKHYVYKKEDFTWVKGAPEAVGLLNRLGYSVFVVTNQSGVARGFYTSAQVDDLHGFMRRELSFYGAAVDAFYCCPHHPDHGGPCGCRKPQPGLLLRAMKEYCVDRERSFLIGDKQTDIEAAQNAGLAGYLFTGDDLFTFVKDILNMREAV